MCVAWNTVAPRDPPPRHSARPTPLPPSCAAAASDNGRDCCAAQTELQSLIAACPEAMFGPGSESTQREVGGDEKAWCARGPPSRATHEIRLRSRLLGAGAARRHERHVRPVAAGTHVRVILLDAVPQLAQQGAVRCDAM